MLLPWKSFLLMLFSTAAIAALSPRATAAPFMLGTPARLHETVDTPGPEQAPELAADDLKLYYTKGNYAANPDIWVATRPSLDDPWNQPQSVGPTVNTPRGEASPAISPDGRELYFDDGNREGYPSPLRPGGMGGADIWISRYQDNNTWSEPENVGPPINSRFREYGANLSADGLELYFSSDRPGGIGGTDMWVSRRPSINDPWAEPEHLGAAVNSSSHDERPALSPDGRLLVFGSNRPGGGGGPSSLWLAARDQTTDDWGPPVALNSINGPYWNWDPSFSPDGASLFYGRYDSGSGHTLWELPLLPLEAVPLRPGAGAYTQAFDETLGPDGSATETVLPAGWATSENGALFDNTVTQSFRNRQVQCLRNSSRNTARSFCISG